MITTTKAECRERGEQRAERGVKRAAFKHRPDIEQGTVKFLNALLASPTACATLDDAADSLRIKYADGGKWRASIVKRLQADGLIVCERVLKSARPARHAGYLAEWRLINRGGAERRRAELLAAQAFDNQPKDAGESAATETPAVNSITLTTNGVNEHGSTKAV